MNVIATSNENLNFKVDPVLAMELTMRMYHAKFEETWTREIIQNSVDAKATRINIETEFNHEKMLSIISVEDDGHGMTPDVIYNKFLSLGGSHKQTGENGERTAIGGFGIAKTIVLGGNTKHHNPYGEQVRWFVETTVSEDDSLSTYYFDSEMIGKSGLKQIATKNHPGTKIVIFRKREKSYEHREHLFTNIIENCNVIPIYFNGRELLQLKRSQEKDISHLFDEDVDTSWLKVRYKKTVLSHQKNHVIFRIRGIYQFQQWESTIPGSLIIEIQSNLEPTDDLYPLTPNREQIKDEKNYQDIVRAVIEYFKIYQDEKENDDFKLEIFENPNFNHYSYDSYFGKTAQEEIEENNSLLKTKVLDPEEQLEVHDCDEVDLVEETLKEEALLANTEDEKEREFLLDYELIQQQKDEQRRKVEKVDSVFTKFIQDIHNHKEEDIFHFRSILTPQIASITIKQDKYVKSQIDLYNMKNIKTLLTFKVFIDLFFELAKDEIHSFNYNVGWTLKNTEDRVELYERDYEYFLLLNPIGLNISNVRLFTSSLLQRIAFEVLKKSHYVGSDSFSQKYFSLMEKVVNPNIRIFERTAKRIMKNN